MTTVFEIINELREAKGMSVRNLGAEAGIKPTTFESVMSRKPRSIDIERLGAIAGIFGLEWQDLFEEGREVHGKGTAKPKVDTYIKDEEKPYILRNAFEKAGIQGYVPPYINVRATFNETERFREMLHALIERLNDNGVMEALSKLSDIERKAECRK